MTKHIVERDKKKVNIGPNVGVMLKQRWHHTINIIPEVRLGDQITEMEAKF